MQCCAIWFFLKPVNTFNNFFNSSFFNNSKAEKILDVTIESKLTFKSHIKTLCKKTAQKIEAL